MQTSSLDDVPLDSSDAGERRGSRRRPREAKASMHRLVMEYLVSKGYREVAEAFLRDSDTKPTVDLQMVQERMSVQQLLLDGRIQSARAKLVKMDPNLLQKDSAMDFLLVKQELLELIREQDIEEALQFAVKNLAPFGQMGPQFLHEIERTMSLLAFQNPSESPLGHLLEQSQRRQVADEVNSAILRSQVQEPEPMLSLMVQQFYYMEEQLEAKLDHHSQGVRLEDPTR
uniref:CTLH domain-containing protein n=1 Tax=Peronospora matthiolae TaxID=2874970 RepID=A0AAV1TJ72_9STRA